VYQFSPADLCQFTFADDNDEYISITSAVGIDRLSRAAFEQRLDDEIMLTAIKVAAGTYTFSQYKEKLVSKGADKYPRVISIPTFRDRMTLRALCNVLKKTFAAQLDVKLPQHTVSELRTSLTEGGYDYFVKLDVTNFYPSINHTVLQKTLNRKILKPQIRQLISSAIETQTVAFPDRLKAKASKGVPQGLAISNILAEIYLMNFDSWASKVVDTAYFRYVDDILILTKSDPEQLFETVKVRLLNEYRLTAHELGNSGKSVIGTISEDFHFLGYEFKHGKAGIKIDSIRRLEASLAKILTTYKYRYAAALANTNPVERNFLLAKAKKICMWRLNLRITGCIFDSVRRGWVFYFSQIDDQALAQLHHLDKTISVLTRRFALTFKPGELKSFARAFHESKRSDLSHRYIPNFDTTSIAKQREILEMYGMDGVALMTEDQVARAFKRRIRRETSELVQDIQGTS
jgi:RNA-directed DNA polymerase